MISSTTVADILGFAIVIITNCVCYRRQMKSTKVLFSQQTSDEEETEAMNSQYNYISDIIRRSGSIHSVKEEVVDLTKDDYLIPIDTRNFMNQESNREADEKSL
jgi:hypothetical protein